MSNQENEFIANNVLEILLNAYFNNLRPVPTSVPAPVPTSVPAPVPTSVPTSVPAPDISDTNPYGLYFGIIQTLRETISGYNTNTRIILETIRALRQDINNASNQRLATNRNESDSQQRRHYARNMNTGLPNSAGGSGGTRHRPVRLFNIDLLSTTNTPSNLQDVVVRPTEHQLDIALEPFTYLQSEFTTSRCPITLEDFNEGDVITRIRHCGHIFHTQSIQDWFSGNVRCPVCRRDIRDYIVPSDIDVSNNVLDVSNNVLDVSNNVLDVSNNVLDVSNNVLDVSNNVSTGLPNVEQSLQGLSQSLTDNITNIITTYFANNDFANNVDLSMNQIFRFEMPIVTTTRTTTYNNEEDDLEDDEDSYDDNE